MKNPSTLEVKENYNKLKLEFLRQTMPLDVLKLTDNKNFENCLHYSIKYMRQDKFYINGSTPVSYTHLDVYKRQIFNNFKLCDLLFFISHPT